VVVNNDVVADVVDVVVVVFGAVVGFVVVVVVRAVTVVVVVSVVADVVVVVVVVSVNEHPTIGKATRNTNTSAVKAAVARRKTGDDGFFMGAMFLLEL
jgi:hypothetical protein